MTCLQCGVGKTTGRRNICVGCTFVRAHHSGRAKAGSLVAKEIREGRMQPARNFACTDCGVPAVDYDHRDYHHPLMVEPVCRRCNCKRGPGKWVQYKPVRQLLAEARARVVSHPCLLAA